jgi:chaperonin GroEL (HSP60 family)
MAAKLATVDEQILARMGEVSAIGQEIIIARSASEEAHPSGIQFECGYLSPYFVTDPARMECSLENAYVLIHEKKISFRNDVLPLLEQITKSGMPLLIIAENVEGEALAALVVRKLRGSLRVAAVRTPGLGDQRKSMLQDIALLTRGTAITEDLDIQLKNISISSLGQAKKITIGKSRTIIEGNEIEGKAHDEWLLFRSDPCFCSKAPAVTCATFADPRDSA